MKRRIVAILLISLVALGALSARTLDLFDVPFSDKSILWPEVGRDSFEMERGEFELEGPEERWFEISLEGEEKKHHFGSRKSFLKRELNSIMKDEEKDAREDNASLNVLVSLSDDMHYHLTLEVADRFGVYYKSFMGVFSDSGAFYEFEAEYLKDDSFSIEKIEESLLSLQ